MKTRIWVTREKEATVVNFMLPFTEIMAWGYNPMTLPADAKYKPEVHVRFFQTLISELKRDFVIVSETAYFSSTYSLFTMEPHRFLAKMVVPAGVEVYSRDELPREVNAFVPSDEPTPTRPPKEDMVEYTFNSDKSESFNMEVSVVSGTAYDSAVIFEFDDFEHVLAFSGMLHRKGVRSGGFYLKEETYYLVCSSDDLPDVPNNDDIYTIYLQECLGRYPAADFDLATCKVLIQDNAVEQLYNTFMGVV